MGRPHLTTEERALAFRLRAKGLTFKEIGEQLDSSMQTAWNVLMKAPKQLIPVDAWTPRPGRLTLADREEISLGLRGGETFSAIAKKLGRHLSTVSREVAANGGRGAYRAWRAHQRARLCARRPKARKLASVQLADQVTQWLSKWWSPQEIARRLRVEYPDDPMMWVSHETIYKTLFVQGRGELRRELARCLRSGRAQRRPQGRVETRGRIPGMVSISERPAEVDDRAVPGHWEGDLIIGMNGKSQVGTLVERSTRYVMLLHLPDGRFPAQVDEAMRQAVAALPKELFRTLTWDQGKEMHRHASFTIDTGIQIYFCDPHSPWQRGSNENTNGLLRQYMPKGTDLSTHSAADLNRFAASLNDRPRATLEYMKPSEKLAELLALTG
ncbi:MAG TPA: IS30 family transposase [Acidimicrobiales bacterium]